MPLDPVTLLPLGVIGLLALFGGKKKTKKKTKKKAPEVCAPYAIDRDAVASQVDVAVKSNMVGEDRIAAYVGKTLYPKDANGKTVPWPTAPPWSFPPGTAEPLLCLYGEIKDIVRTLDVPEDPGTTDPTPSEILTTLLASTPTPGKLYLVKKHDVALGNDGLIAQALNKVVPGSGSDGTVRLSYLRHMTGGSGDWNYDKYGRTANTSSWPSYTNSNGRNLGAGFLPRNVNAIAAIADGRDPPRNLTLEGAKAGSGASYALFWFPPIDGEALASLNVITSAGLHWDDGSSVLNPPPVLLSQLTK